jgi:hypothetical protein
MPLCAGGTFVRLAGDERPYAVKAARAMLAMQGKEVSMSRWHQLDGFQLLMGVVALIAGPVMLATGFPAGWSLLVLAAGAVVLLAQWAIVAGLPAKHSHH